VHTFKKRKKACVAYISDGESFATEQQPCPVLDRLAQLLRAFSIHSLLDLPFSFTSNLVKVKSG